MNVDLLKQLFPLPAPAELHLEAQRDEPFPCFGRFTGSQARPVLVEAIRCQADADIIEASYYQIIAEAVQEGVEDATVSLSSFEEVARRMAVCVTPLGHGLVLA